MTATLRTGKSQGDLRRLHQAGIVEDVGQLGDARDMRIGRRDSKSDHDADGIVVRVPEDDRNVEGDDREAVREN